MGQFTNIAKIMRFSVILILSLAATGTAAVFTTSICQELLTERRLYAGLFGGFVPYPINSLLDRRLSYWECLPENTERPVTEHPRTPVHTPTPHKPHTEKPTFIVDPNNPCIGEFWENDGNGGVVTVRRNICNQPTKPTTSTHKPVVTQKPTTHKTTHRPTQRPTQKPTTTFTPTFIVDPNNPCIGEFWEKDGSGGVVVIRRNICNQPTEPTTSNPW